MALTPFNSLYIFPQAEQRGLSSSTVGFIFSIFSLSAFLFSPLFGKIVSTSYFFTKLTCNIQANQTKNPGGSLAHCLVHCLYPPG